MHNDTVAAISNVFIILPSCSPSVIKNSKRTNFIAEHISDVYVSRQLQRTRGWNYEIWFQPVFCEHVLDWVLCTVYYCVSGIKATAYIVPVYSGRH